MLCTGEAQAAGIIVDWNDFSDISSVTPLLARVYPNGTADINQFHAAGGMAFITRELLLAGLLHGDIPTVAGNSLADYARDPAMDGEQLVWRDVPESRDESILRAATNPFRADGGMRLVKGNLGRAIFKTSAVDEERWTIEAPARVFEDQESVQAAFKAGELDLDVVVVVRGQGPQANGMPELHKLMPLMGALQDRGFRVALATDGRMSGASGKVLVRTTRSIRELVRRSMAGPDKTPWVAMAQTSVAPLSSNKWAAETMVPPVSIMSSVKMQRRPSTSPMTSRA